MRLERQDEVLVLADGLIGTLILSLDYRNSLFAPTVSPLTSLSSRKS